MQSNNWAPAHTEALIKYLARGMSYSAIADAINLKFRTSYSRCAAIGRAKRMGLAGPDRSEGPERIVPTKVQPKAKLRRLRRMRERNLAEPWQVPPIFEATEVVKLRCADVVPHRLSLLDLRRGDCRYPYGGDEEGEAITFCGHPRRPGSSYCAAHFALSIGPGTASERDAGAVLLRIVAAA